MIGFGRKNRGVQEPSFFNEELEPRLLLSATTGIESALASLTSPLDDGLGSIPELVIQADEPSSQDNVEILDAEISENTDAETLFSLDLSGGTEDLNAPVTTDSTEASEGETGAGEGVGAGEILVDYQVDPVVNGANFESETDDILSGNSENGEDYTEVLTDTLLAPNPPPTGTQGNTTGVFDAIEGDLVGPQAGAGEVFTFIAGPGSNDFTLRISQQDPSYLELFNKNPSTS